MSTNMDQVKRQKHPCPASRGQAGGDLGSSFEFHHRCTKDTFSRSASPSWAHCADHPAAVLAGHLGEAMFASREPHWDACLTACTDVLAGTEAGTARQVMARFTLPR
jgi:hypothetical protein